MNTTNTNYVIDRQSLLEEMSDLLSEAPRVYSEEEIERDITAQLAALEQLKRDMTN